MTIERAEKILRDSDACVPEKFEVVRVVYSKQVDAYFVEWTDVSARDAYRNAVADSTDVRSAENAYSVGGWRRFSVIFDNDGTDGSGRSFAAQTLDDDDLNNYLDLTNLSVIDAK